jgi:hypothetical protein
MLFLNISNHENMLKSHLITHLDWCTLFYAQLYYTIENFPFEEAIT